MKLMVSAQRQSLSAWVHRNHGVTGTGTSCIVEKAVKIEKAAQPIAWWRAIFFGAVLRCRNQIERQR